MLRLRLIFSAIFATISTCAFSAVLEFTDYGAFTSATAGETVFVEDFEGVPSTTPFTTSTAKVGDLTLETNASAKFPFNQVHVANFSDNDAVETNQVFSSNSRSAFALVGLRNENDEDSIGEDETFSILFDDATNVFGAYFGGLNNAVVQDNGSEIPVERTVLVINGIEFELPKTGSSEGPNGGERSFYGIITDFAFNSVTFKTIRLSDGFGIDEIQYVKLQPSEIPVPASLPLILSGLVAMGALHSRKKKLSS